MNGARLVISASHAILARAILRLLGIIGVGASLLLTPYPDGARSQPALPDSIAARSDSTTSPPPVPVAVIERILPAWTSTLRVPDSLVIRDQQDTLGAVAGRLRESLSRAGLGPSGMFAAGDGGFVLISAPERINDDGAAAEVRQDLQCDDLPPLSIWERLFHLFEHRSCRFRTVLFAVTMRPDSAGSEPATLEQVDSLSRAGLAHLPPEIESHPSGEYHCQAYILEYRRRPGRSAEFLKSSDLTVPQHLIKAQLWTAGQLPPR